MISRYSGCKCRREKTVPSTNPDAEARAADKAADPIAVDPATKPEAKPGAQPIDSVVYLDSVDAVKAPVDPVARANELDPIDLLEARE